MIKARLRAKGACDRHCKIAILHADVFGDANVISCHKGCDRHFEIAILLLCESFCRGHFKIAILPQFRAKGLRRDDFKIANFTTVFGDRTSLRAKGFAGQEGRLQNRNFTAVFGDRTSFRAKWLSRHDLQNRNFTAVFGDRTSFRAKGLSRHDSKPQVYCGFWRSNLVSCEKVAFCAVSLALPRAFKREIEKKERARGQWSRRAREQQGKRECEDVKMRRCEDEKM